MSAHPKTIAVDAIGSPRFSMFVSSGTPHYALSISGGASDLAIERR